jgi:prophage antirepressor-like protein
VKVEKQLMVFEGRHEVMILTKADVNFDFKGDFLIRAKDVAVVLDYQGSSSTTEILKFAKDDQVFMVKNSDMVNRHDRKLNNAGEAFVTNLALNRVLGKSEKPKAAPFQDWLYEDMLPSINKHGAYLTPAKIEEVLADPDTIIRIATQLKLVQAERKQLAEENAEKQRELDYKGDVIIGLVDDIDLMEKRQTLNRIMRKRGSQYENRWNELYYQFEKKYHLDLEYQLEKYNKTHKPKLKGKIDFIDKVMGKLPELYELACKLFVNDVDKLVKEMYGVAAH